MDIKEAIKQLEDLKKDRLSFVTGDAEHDNIFLRDVRAIEIVLGNLEALADMQRTADKELKNSLPKQVIEDKIDELKSQSNYRTFNNPNGRIHFLKEETDYKIEALEELLQESEE